jgi:hypothetical protein
MSDTQAGDIISFLNEDGFIITCTVTSVRAATDDELTDIVREHGGHIELEADTAGMTRH